MKSVVAILVCCLFACCAMPLQAQHLPFTDYQKYGMDTTTLPTGLKVGQQAPLFSGVNESGKTVGLQQLLAKGPVVLIFYRGYWCPACMRYLQQYTDSLQLITAKGATLIAVTSEGAEGVQKTRKKINPGFQVITDTTGTIMRLYDVNFNVTEAYTKKIKNSLSADIAGNNATGRAELPVPATFIINSRGVITYRQFDPNYKNRATVQEILEHL